MKTGSWIPAVFIVCWSLPAEAQSVSRGPYLQEGGPSTVTVRWRTSTAVAGRVRYGASAGSLTSFKDGSSTTEHVIKLTGLAANTKYFYSIGTTSTTLAGDSSYFFLTHPAAGAAKPTRVWVVGDAGTANSSQKAVRDAYNAYTGTRHTDLWLQLGDNAYSDGTDAEYQKAVFDIYTTMLRQSVTWPTLGNHDGHSADSATQSGPYYDIFTLPKKAKTDGLSSGIDSGTEAYYSFDYGNIHFICLDSYETSRSPTGTMATWARNDADATTRDWLIAFWHHPPYSKGSHDSDSDGTMSEMRKNFLPILEDAGVDLVLSGHSHCYERSFLLDGHYGVSSTLTAAMKKDGGSGRDAGAYQKSSGLPSHEGAVYIVAGASGKVGGGSLDHKAMYLSLNELGSVVLDVDGNRMDVKYLRSDGTVRDYYTLIKGGMTPPPGDTTPPTITISTPTTASTHATTSTPITIGGSASDNVGVTQIAWSNARTGGTGVATALGPWNASVPLASGANAITVTARDAAGNTSTDTITVTYTPPAGDTTPPAISIATPTTASTFSATSEPVTVGGTATDNVSVATVTWSNAATGDTGTAAGTANWSASIDLASGANVITVTAVDSSGNTKTDTITVTYTASVVGGVTATAGHDNENGNAWPNDKCAGGSIGASGRPLGLLLIAAVLLLGRRRR